MFRRAAELDDSCAQFNVAICLCRGGGPAGGVPSRRPANMPADRRADYGTGTPVNRREARRWLWRSADQGYRHARQRLGPHFLGEPWRAGRAAYFNASAAAPVAAAMAAAARRHWAPLPGTVWLVVVGFCTRDMLVTPGVDWLHEGGAEDDP
jgi:hypothetical protein